ncbi:MAG: hypothetical protein R3E95_07925 [Thiolinea sp.]
MADVTVKARLRGFAPIRTAQLKIEGLNMYMGLQIIPLQFNTSTQPASNTKEAGQQQQEFVGLLTLPVCSTRNMQWQASLEIAEEAQSYRSTFPFSTSAP